jgi:hypothetical protein
MHISKEHILKLYAPKLCIRAIFLFLFNLGPFIINPALKLVLIFYECWKTGAFKVVFMYSHHLLPEVAHQRTEEVNIICRL